MPDTENDKSELQEKIELENSSEKDDELTEKQRDQLDSIFDILAVSKQLSCYGYR